MKQHQRFLSVGPLTLAATALFVMAACSSTKAPASDPAVAQARAALTSLQSDSTLATLAQTSLRDAEQAVVSAEKANLTNDKNPALTAHLAYLAQNKVDIARAVAGARYAEDRVKSLSNERSQVLLDSRTREADAAHQRAAELEQELADLKQQQTDRGTVFTLSDVLFSTGKADVKPGSIVNIQRLAERLNQEPERTIVIEGHTDSTGSVDLNNRLSQQRADAVKFELAKAGVAASRITSFGKGQSFPIASNNTQEGRQQNRRVEVILQ